MATEKKNREEDASALSSHYVFCPGRVCLFGEHSDWAGGMRRFNPEIPVGKTLVCGTNVGIHARTRALPTLLIVTSTDEMGNKHGPFSVPMEPEALLAVANQGTFFSYAAGVAYHMLCHYRVGGLEIDNYETDLPLKKGLSSSAAFCVLVARAFDRAYSLRLTVRGEMECAFAGERLTPSKCGRMDQACAFGSRPVLMTYDADFLKVEPVLVSEPLHLLLVDRNPSSRVAVEEAGRDGGYSWICRPGTLILQAAGLIQHPLNLPARSRTKTPQILGEQNENGMQDEQLLHDKHTSPASFCRPSVVHLHSPCCPENERYVSTPGLQGTTCRRRRSPSTQAK